MRCLVGLQYANYLADDLDHVLKVPLSLEEIEAQLAQNPELAQGADLYPKAKQIHQTTQRSTEYIKHREELHPIFGIIAFTDQGVLQHKVKPLYQLQKDPDEFKKAYRGYIDLCHHMWAMGLFENTWNYSVNFGVDPAGRIICLDIGEVQTQKELLLQSLADQQWRNQHSYRALADPTLKEFVFAMAQQHLTVEQATQYWPNS